MQTNRAKADQHECRRGSLRRLVVTLAVALASVLLFAGPAAAQDPLELSDLPELPRNEFLEVSQNGGVYLPDPACWAHVHGFFVAEGATTPYWVSDNGETDVIVATSDVAEPTPSDMTCEVVTFGDLPTASGFGYDGSLKTEPGRTYWLGFAEEDGPFVFNLNPDGNAGERFILDGMPIVDEDRVIELPDRPESLVASGPEPWGQGIRTSFVATSELTTIATDDYEHLICLFSSPVPQPQVADLEKQECDGDQNNGNVYFAEFSTTVGERYWITLDTDDPSDQAYIVVNPSDLTDPLLDERFEAMSLTEMNGFTLARDRDDSRLDVPAAAECGTVVARFTATSTDTTLWAKSLEGVIGSFSILKAAVAPSDPGYIGLEVHVDCNQSWSEASASGSVTSTFDTQPGTEYWLTWKGDSAVVLAPADDRTEAKFTDPLHYYSRPLSQIPTLATCADDGASGEVTFTFVDEGYVDQSVGRTLDFTVDGETVETLRTTTYSDRYWLSPAPSYTVTVPLELGTQKVQIVDGDNVLGSWTLDPFCESTTYETVSTCAGGLARIDVVIVNPTDEAITYIAEFSHEAADGETVIRKSSLVGAQGQGRIAVTGRPSATPIKINLYRDGVLESQTNGYEKCWASPLNVTPVITTSCLQGNGLVRFALDNPSGESAVWRIGFEGLRDRTTSAPPQGIGFSGVSGRPDGDYEVSVARDGQPIHVETVTVDCDS